MDTEVVEDVELEEINWQSSASLVEEFAELDEEPSVAPTDEVPTPDDPPVLRDSPPWNQALVLEPPSANGTLQSSTPATNSSDDERRWLPRLTRPSAGCR